MVHLCIYGRENFKVVFSEKFHRYLNQTVSNMRNLYILEHVYKI